MRFPIMISVLIIVLLTVPLSIVAQESGTGSGVRFDWATQNMTEPYKVLSLTQSHDIWCALLVDLSGEKPKFFFAVHLETPYIFDILEKEGCTLGFDRDELILDMDTTKNRDTKYDGFKGVYAENAYFPISVADNSRFAVVKRIWFELHGKNGSVKGVIPPQICDSFRDFATRAMNGMPPNHDQTIKFTFGYFPVFNYYGRYSGISGVAFSGLDQAFSMSAGVYVPVFGLSADFSLLFIWENVSFLGNQTLMFDLIPQARVYLFQRDNWWNLYLFGGIGFQYINFSEKPGTSNTYALAWNVGLGASLKIVDSMVLIVTLDFGQDTMPAFGSTWMTGLLFYL